MPKYTLIGLGLSMALLVFCAGCDRAEPSANQPVSPPAGPSWGLTINGLQAGLDIKRPAETGGPKPLLVLRLRNASDKPVRILRLSAQRAFWGENLPLLVMGGEKVLTYQGPVLTPPPPPSRQAYIDLAPGEADSVQVEMNPDHWRLKDISKATASFVFTNHERSAHTSPGNGAVMGLWTGSTRSPRMILATGAIAHAANTDTLRGRAMLKGKPVPGMAVKAFTGNSAPVIAETRTDADGRFVLRNLPRQGKLTLVASKVREDYWWLQGEVNVTLGKGVGDDVGDIPIGAIAPPTATPESPPIMPPGSSTRPAGR